MKIKLLLKIIMLVLLFSITDLYSTDYYVKTNGDNSADGTNWSTAWATIQYAAATLRDDDKAIISNGIYFENNISIADSGTISNRIIFEGYDPGNVIIDAENNAYGFNNNIQSNIVFSGLVIQHAGSGIRLYGTDRCIITNCFFINNDRGIDVYGTGIFNDPAENNIIKNSYFSNNTGNEAINLGVKERYNIIMNNRIVHNYHGISWGSDWATPSLSNTIYSNYISHNTSRGINIYISFAEGTISYNTINSNGSTGIRLQEVARTMYFSNNRIIGNDGDGIDIIGSWGAQNLGYKEFYYNIIAKNKGYGVKCNIGDSTRIQDAYDVVFYGNSIYSNNNYGLFLCGDSIATFRNMEIISNNIYGNGTYGIYFTAYDNNADIKNNNIKKHTYGSYIGYITDLVIASNNYCTNRYSGIYLTGNNSFNIHNNNIYSNGSFGIRVNCDLNNSRIMRNNIYSNSLYGIYFSSESADGCSIVSNNIYGFNQDYGLYILSGDQNTIKSNYIHHNERFGIYLSGSARSNNVFNNEICSNVKNGIVINGMTAMSNTVISNQIFGPTQDRGVMLTNTADHVISGNNIYNHDHCGIESINSTNSFIQYNSIFSNHIGLLYDNSFLYVFLNNIINNDYGLVCNNGEFKYFIKNNLSPNNRFSISNISSVSIKVTNNWWGNVQASSINNNAHGITSYSNFTPYRLFGSFDINIGADTETPAIIENLLSFVSGATVQLKWNRSTSSDFKRYSVYRSTIPGTTNLQRSDVITNVDNINQTNIFDVPGHGMFYYTVTALDNKLQYTNESWYADITNASVILSTTISIVKSISNVSLNSISRLVIPGATVTYKILYANNGLYSGNNIVIYDRIPSFVTFETNDEGTAIGWSFEYSTNTIPAQNYNSSDYLSGYPSDKSKVKWIRWKKNSVSPSEDDQSLVYKVIIK